MSPLFSQALRARVQCCEDEPTGAVHRVTTERAGSRTSCPQEAEGERGSLRSICVPDEDQWAQAPSQGGRCAPKRLGPRKSKDERGQAALWHGKRKPHAADRCTTSEP